MMIFDVFDIATNTVDALLLTTATILFGHFLRSILLSKLKMVTTCAATIQERYLKFAPIICCTLVHVSLKVAKSMKN